MSLIGSSANKPFATLSLETLFKFLKNGKPTSLFLTLFYRPTSICEIQTNSYYHTQNETRLFFRFLNTISLRFGSRFRFVRAKVFQGFKLFRFC